MKNFAIRELEYISGIKAHTLRIWEHRYGILHPERSKTNNRYYGLTEVAKLLHIAILNKNGFRISKLSRLNFDETENKVIQLKDDESRQEHAVAQLLLTMYSMDLDSFESIIEKAFSLWETQAVVKNIIYPFLVKTKLLWEGNGLSEEHMVVTSVRKKLMCAIENTPSIKNGKTVILFLFGTKLLDLGMLYINYILKISGIHVVNLGNDVSVANLVSVSEKIRPQYFYTYLQKKNNQQFDEFSNWLSLNLPQAKLLTTTSHVLAENTFENAIELNNSIIYTVISA